MYRTAASGRQRTQLVGKFTAAVRKISQIGQIRSGTGRPVCEELAESFIRDHGGLEMALLDDRPGRPRDVEMRKALRNWAFVLPGPDSRELPREIGNILHWG